jgi:hypothetical protein
MKLDANIFHPRATVSEEYCYFRKTALLFESELYQGLPTLAVGRLPFVQGEALSF